MAERGSQGIPPLALDSSQARPCGCQIASRCEAESVVEMLKKAPADGAFYVDLLKNRINPGVPGPCSGALGAVGLRWTTPAT